MKISPIEKKAAKTSADLRQIYRIGVEAKEGAGDYGGKVEERIAEKYERSSSSVAQARSFAKMVDPTELEEICQLRNSKGAAFGPGLATRILPLKKREDRDRYFRRWQKKSLSATDVSAKIQAEFGRSSGGGRKSKQPASVAEAISQLHDRCSNWVNWYEQLVDKDVGKMSLKDLPAPVQRQLISTITEVKKLQDLTK